MSIREDIVLDPTKGIKGLDEMNRATMKYARKQERLYKQNQKSIQAIETELRRLRAAREASNSPRAQQKYTQTIHKLEKQQRSLRKETEKYKRSVRDTAKTSESSFKKIGRSAKLWLAGAAAGAILYISSLLRDMGGETMRFNEEMNKSLAIQGDVTIEQRNRMEKAAKEVARELNIATDEVAKGFFFLASAGLDVEQQIANLPAVAEFAKAGMFDLATATDLATDAQSALGMTVENTAQNQRNLIRVTDVLTKANTISNATIEQFSESLTNKAATRLRQFNKDVEEGTAVLAAYADQGIKGRLAGERLNILYRELARTWRENTESFRELGIEVFDQNGEMRNTADILQELESAFQGMSSEQRDYTLAMLGFTSESQDSINALIGMSDEVRGYEEELRNAAGTTEEVANEQLKSLTERLGLLKRQLIDTFGDDVVNAIESVVNLLESLHRSISDTTEEIRRESVITGALEDIGGLFGSDLTGWGFKKLQQDLKGLYDQQRQNTDEFKRQNRELVESMESYATWASGVEGASEKVQDANEELLFREMVLERNIERNEELIKSEDTSTQQKAKLIVQNELFREQLASVQGAIDKTRKFLNQTTEEEEQQEKQVRKLADQYDNLRVKSLQAVSVLGDKIGEFNTSISNAITQHAVRQVDEYNQQLTRLNNEFSAGIITQQEYEQQLEKLTSTFLGNLQELYKSIKDDLTPTQQDLFKKLFGNFKDSSDATEDVKGNLEDIADMASALLNVADAFGEISDSARKSLRGIVDVLRNVEKLKDASGLGSVIPAIGVGAGIASILSGLLQSGDDGRQRQRQLELVNELKSLKREISKNTDALLEQAQIGADISQGQIATAESLIRQLTGTLSADLQQMIRQFSGMSDLTKGVESKVARQFIEENIKDIINQLSESGIPGLENVDQLFETLLNEIGGENLSFEELEQVLRILVEGGEEFEGLSDILSTVNDNLGQFGESINGAIERFNMMTKLGQDREEAFDTFIQDVIGLIGGDNKMTALLEQIAETTDPDERRSLANQLFDLFQQNPDLIGSDLTGSDLQEIIDLILSQESSSSASSSGGFTKSVQIARTITEIQANEVIALLASINHWTRTTAAKIGDKTAIEVSRSGGMTNFNIPIPLPVRVENIGDLRSSSIENKTTNNVSVNVHGADLRSDRGIERLMMDIKKGLKRELRSRRF